MVDLTGKWRYSVFPEKSADLGKQHLCSRLAEIGCSLVGLPHIERACTVLQFDTILTTPCNQFAPCLYVSCLDSVGIWGCSVQEQNSLLSSPPSVFPSYLWNVSYALPIMWAAGVSMVNKTICGATLGLVRARAGRCHHGRGTGSRWCPSLGGQVKSYTREETQPLLKNALLNWEEGNVAMWWLILVPPFVPPPNLLPVPLFASI